MENDELPARELGLNRWSFSKVHLEQQRNGLKQGPGPMVAPSKPAQSVAEQASLTIAAAKGRRP